MNQVLPEVLTRSVRRFRLSVGFDLNPTKVAQLLGCSNTEDAVREWDRLRRRWQNSGQPNILVVPGMPPGVTTLSALREGFPEKFDAVSFERYARGCADRGVDPRPFTLETHPQTRGWSWSSVEKRHPELVMAAPEVAVLAWTMVVLVGLGRADVLTSPLFARNCCPYEGNLDEAERSQLFLYVKGGQVHCGAVRQRALDLKSPMPGYLIPALATIWRFPQTPNH